MHCRNFVRGSFPGLDHVSSKIPSRRWTSFERHGLCLPWLLQSVPLDHLFPCTSMQRPFGQCGLVCIGCRIQRDAVALWFLNSRNYFSEDLFIHYTDNLFHYCRWQIVCVFLAAIGLSFEMICKKVVGPVLRYWYMVTLWAFCCCSNLLWNIAWISNKEFHFEIILNRLNMNNNVHCFKLILLISCLFNGH